MTIQNTYIIEFNPTNCVSLIGATTIGIVIILLIVRGVAPAYSQVVEITVKEWQVPTPNSAPHDIVVDSSGIVWFTEINTNKIGRFDPKTEQFSEFDIPIPSSRPHGLVSDDNGNIWFTESGASKIGRVDPQTGGIEEYPTLSPGLSPHTPIIRGGSCLVHRDLPSKIGRLNLTTVAIDEFSTPTQNSSPYRHYCGFRWKSLGLLQTIGPQDREGGLADRRNNRVFSTNK